MILRMLWRSRYDVFISYSHKDDAVVKPSTQKLLESYDAKVEYFEVCAVSGHLPGQLARGN